MAGGGKRAVKVRMQQVLVEDGTVNSMQSLDFPAQCRDRLTPSLLLRRYYEFIRRFTWSLIRPVFSADGMRFTLLGSRLSLLSFSLPQYLGSDREGRVDLVITGGLLVQAGRGGNGKFSFLVEDLAEGVRVTIEVSRFSPLLLGSPTPSWFRRMLYSFTQASVHEIITVRFLVDLYRHLTGLKLTAELERVHVWEGRDI